MRERRNHDPSDDRELSVLLQRWSEVQPTERETRRLLRSLEVRWTEEQSRYDRCRQQDTLFGISLLLFAFAGSSLVWMRPGMELGRWWLLAAALAGVIVVMLLPALMKFDRRGPDRGE